MCTSPRTASFNPDGSINFSHKHHNKEMVPFKLPCGKCTECLLERARDWSVRCIHEASTNDQNSFITLTYADEHLPADRQLDHTHFQLFMKKLRKLTNKELGFFMCGEYGEKNGRPHYHACIFGYDFPDKVFVRENEHGDQIWTSKILDSLWTYNDPELCPNEIGSVTQKSAGYVARYVLKKQSPEAPQGYQKMSRKNAIGKAFIERWYKDIFIHARGAIILSDGTRTKVPRYYEKWLHKTHPDLWVRYVTQTKLENTKRLQQKAEQEHEIYLREKFKRGSRAHSYKSPLARKRDILKHKQKQLKRNYL